MYKYFIVFFCTPLSLVAVEQQPVYPWYQAYKDPAFRQKVSQGISRSWQSTKDLISRNKRELAIAATLLSMAYIGKRGYTAYAKIAQEFAREGLDLQVIKHNKDYGRLLYLDLVNLGLSAYSHRFDSRIAKDKFINENVMQSRIYKKLGTEKPYKLSPMYEKELRVIYEGQLSQQSGGQERLQRAVWNIMN